MTIMRASAAILSLLCLMAGSRADARVTCPPNFSFKPKSGAGCVQGGCLEAGGRYDGELRCTCGTHKACTEPVSLKRRAKAMCKGHCPETRIVACVPQSQPCPRERQVPCKQDGDCPSCTYCREGQCVQATAVIATSAASSGRRGRRVKGGWGRSRVTFWPRKAWIAQFFWMQGCRLAFKELEEPEDLADLLSSDQVKALAYFGYCTEKNLKKLPKAKDPDAAAQTRYRSTMEGISAADLREEVTEVIEERLVAKLRRSGERGVAAKKKATEEAKRITQNGWLHFLLNDTCSSFDDNSMPDNLVRPGGIYWGRKGGRHVGIPLTRHERPE